MKVEGGRMTEIGEMIPQRYCSGRDAGGHDAEERKAPLHKSLNSEEIIRTGTRITQIGRIYTDPGVSVSTVAPVDVAQPSRPLTPCTRMPAHWHTWTRPQGAQPLTYGSCHTWRPVFYRPPPIIHDDKKPQIMAPRVTPLEGVSSYALRGIGVRGVKNPQGFGIDERRFVAIIHRKVREERKAEEQKSLRPLRSLRLINYHGIPTAPGNKATVVFQTGFTGSTGW